MNFINFSIFRKKQKETFAYNKVDNKNIKIIIDNVDFQEDREINNKDKNKIEENNNQIFNDLNTTSKWNSEYTYPPDINILKFRLKGKNPYFLYIY